MRRRTWLVHLGVGISVTLGGCLGSTVEPEEAEGGLELRDEQEQGGTRTAIYDVDIPEGTYAAGSWEPADAIIGEFQLDTEEHPAEFFLMPQDEISDYESGGEVTHDDQFYGTGSTIHVRGQVSAGAYYFVIDNTAFGNQSPEGDLTGELVFEI